MALLLNLNSHWRNFRQSVWIWKRILFATYLLWKSDLLQLRWNRLHRSRPRSWCLAMKQRGLRSVIVRLLSTGVRAKGNCTEPFDRPPLNLFWTPDSRPLIFARNAFGDLTIKIRLSAVILHHLQSSLNPHLSPPLYLVLKCCRSFTTPCSSVRLSAWGLSVGHQVFAVKLDLWVVCFLIFWLLPLWWHWVISNAHSLAIAEILCHIHIQDFKSFISAPALCDVPFTFARLGVKGTCLARNIVQHLSFLILIVHNNCSKVHLAIIQFSFLTWVVCVLPWLDLRAAALGGGCQK